MPAEYSQWTLKPAGAAWEAAKKWKKDNNTPKHTTVAAWRALPLVGTDEHSKQRYHAFISALARPPLHPAGASAAEAAVAAPAALQAPPWCTALTQTDVAASAHEDAERRWRRRECQLLGQVQRLQRDNHVLHSMCDPAQLGTLQQLAQAARVAALHPTGAQAGDPMDCDAAHDGADDGSDVQMQHTDDAPVQTQHTGDDNPASSDEQDVEECAAEHYAVQLDASDLTYAGMRAACEQAGLTVPPHLNNNKRVRWSVKTAAVLAAALAVLYGVQLSHSWQTNVRQNLDKLHTHRRAAQHREKAQVDSSLQLHMLASTSGVCQATHMLQAVASDDSQPDLASSHGWPQLCQQLLAHQTATHAAQATAFQQAATLDAQLAAAQARIEELQRMECKDCSTLQHQLNDRDTKLLRVVRNSMADSPTCMRTM